MEIRGFIFSLDAAMAIALIVLIIPVLFVGSKTFEGTNDSLNVLEFKTRDAAITGMDLNKSGTDLGGIDMSKPFVRCNSSLVIDVNTAAVSQSVPVEKIFCDAK